MGSDVTILGRSLQELNNEDPEVCRIVKKVLSRDLKLLVRHEVIRSMSEMEKRLLSPETWTTIASMSSRPMRSWLLQEEYPTPIS